MDKLQKMKRSMYLYVCIGSQKNVSSGYRSLIKSSNKRTPSEKD